MERLGNVGPIGAQDHIGMIGLIFPILLTTVTNLAVITFVRSGRDNQLTSRIANHEWPQSLRHKRGALFASVFKIMACDCSCGQSLWTVKPEYSPLDAMPEKVKEFCEELITRKDNSEFFRIVDLSKSANPSSNDE